MTKKQEEKEEVKQEGIAEEVVSNTEELQEVKGRVLVSGSEYWDFEENPIFIGTFVSDVIKDKEGDKDHGKLIGFEFEENDTGDLYIISNSHLINKSLEMNIKMAVKDDKGKMVEKVVKVKEIPGAILKFEFKGKRDKQDGEKVNVFRIEML